MRYLELSLPTPEANLALEEALLEQAERSPGGTETLRIWHGASHFVVAGSGSRLREDVDLGACRRDAVPVLRRVSGGGTVLQGPGCLNFTAVLSYARSPQLAHIEGAFRYVLQRARDALAELGHTIDYAGTSDLCIGNRKISGSGQRRKRRHVLVHGTILHGLDLARVARYLPVPRRQPLYRQHRPHGDFLANLTIDPAAFARALAARWNAQPNGAPWPRDEVERLARTKYADHDWLYRR
ncbi:MAG: lipoate--protein ligase family protein [Pirellulales bacterium]